ncbi:MAG: hypothetical protein ABMA64_18525, partial [Myxococcota bacterium]
MELASRRHPRKRVPADPASGGDPLDSVEVVERGPAGGGFVGAEMIDSYAMDDPPSEEVRLDPRFHRVAEPATELIDRESMRAMAEEMLAGPAPHPDELTQSVPFELPITHGAAPVALGAIGAGIALTTPLPRDPATERIDRESLQQTERDLAERDLVEVTVPTPLDELELAGGSPEFTLPAHVGFDAPEGLAAPLRAPDDVSIDEIDPGIALPDPLPP